MLNLNALEVLVAKLDLTGSPNDFTADCFVTTAKK